MAPHGNGEIVLANQETDEEEEEFSGDSIDEREEIRKENLAECRSICCFFFFLLIFSTSLIFEKSASSSDLADHVRAKVTSGSFPLDRVKTIDDFYRYLEVSFVPSMYQNNTDTNMAKTMSEYYHPVDLSNRMVGSARFRQVRVQRKQDCQVGVMFGEYKIACYPEYDVNRESKSAFGPEGKFEWSRDPDGSVFAGKFASYGPDGFMQYLSTNATAALEAIKRLHKENFLGSPTRAAFLDFSVWSKNTGTYAVVTVAAEFGPSGRVETETNVAILSERVLRAGGLGTTADIISFAGIVIVLLFVFFYLWEELQEFWDDKFAYFMDGWNVMDWINMLLIIIGFIVRIMNFSAASTARVGMGALANKDAFANLRAIASTNELVRSLGALNACFIWLKCVKYLRQVPNIKTFIRGIWGSLDQFAPFLLVFLFCFIGFTMAYNIGFGDNVQELASFGSSFIFLARAYLRDVDFGQASEVSPIFAAFMVLLFYVVLVLVGVTFLAAILADAIFTEKCKPKKKFYEMDESDHEDEPVEEFVRLVTDTTYKIADKVLPRRMRKLLMAPKTEQDGGFDDGTNESASMGMLEDQGSEEGGSDMFSEVFEPETGPSRADLMRAIEHMSGRVLSEISIVGIEIKSELHDVCERVAQMQTVVGELIWRTDTIQTEMSEVLDKANG
eukprot:TRINITY_DN54680_c0_g1_i1.p1 TRINITY_DN54680_c0_g1~~TRINITY_DN54680_c0_g1_i1.p1  ORF type:complete len:673 (+),score=167.71 TRINITY_DN54680_c0_g1_i1:135-2153(+)